MEGLKKFVTMRESPYHGLNFCQGTIAEMLDDPAAEIADVIRWFGERKKIFNVHFRNIRGRKLSFNEVFPDEGDMDMWSSIRLYAELGYEYMLMPDHVPEISGPSPNNVAFAFCYGYIAALLQAAADLFEVDYVCRRDRGISYINMAQWRARPGAGRKSMRVEHAIVLRDSQPWRIPELEARRSRALDVMRANMEFFHYRAAEIMAAIIAMPLGEGRDRRPASRLPRHGRLGQMQGTVAAMRSRPARYTHAPMAAKPASDAPSPGKRQAGAHPTPKAVSDASPASQQDSRIA